MANNEELDYELAKEKAYAWFNWGLPPSEFDALDMVELKAFSDVAKEIKRKGN